MVVYNFSSASSRYFLVYLALCENVNFYRLQTAVDGMGLFSASTAGNVSAFRDARPSKIALQCA